MKDIILKILFYTFLATITVICFLVVLAFKVTKDVLLNSEYEPEEEEKNIPPTNIFGQDVERYRLLNVLADD